MQSLVVDSAVSRRHLHAMKDVVGREASLNRPAVDRAAIKRELRSMFAHVEVSLSAELIADRRQAASGEVDRLTSGTPESRAGS
jgi:hypothetical protein